MMAKAIRFIRSIRGRKRIICFVVTAVFFVAGRGGSVGGHVVHASDTSGRGR